MKIKLTQKELDKCNKLLEVKEANISAVEMLIEYLNEHPRDIGEDDMKVLTQKYSLEESFVRAFKKKLKIKPNDEEYEFIDNICSVSKVNCLETNSFKEDPYYKNVGIFKAKEQDWQFVELDYAPYEGFVSDEIQVDNKYFAEHTPFSFFKERFPFLAVLQKDEIWMSVMPHEINTMKEPISKAKGNVLVLGLGLGYFLYNILLKPEVKKVDVVEKDLNVIKLFNTNLIEKFPHLEKINLLKGDAIEYLKNTDKKYDYVFADIWHNVGDGEMLYILLKKQEYRHPQTKFDYWIEKSILAMLRRQTLTVFEELVGGFTEDDYKFANNDNDKIINAIYNYHKDTVIQKFEDLHHILEDDELRKMTANLELN